MAVPLGGGCDLVFDPAGAWVLASRVITTPAWQLAVPVPNLPVLAGISVALQAAFGPTASPLAADLSNGWSWTFGR